MITDHTFNTFIESLIRHSILIFELDKNCPAQISTLSIVCFLSLLRKAFVFCSVFNSIGSSAYCLLALHLKLVFAIFSFASATILLPAVLVGYLCFTPLSNALQRTLQRYSGVSFTNVLCTAATE